MRDSQYYTDFHPNTGKKLLLKGDIYIETVREGQKYFTNITSYRKIWLLCVKLSKLQNKFGQKYKLYLLISFLNNLISFCVLCLMIISVKDSLNRFTTASVSLTSNANVLFLFDSYIWECNMNQILMNEWEGLRSGSGGRR